MTIRYCETKHRDICPDCSQPRIVTCDIHGHCECKREELPPKELVVGYRFESDLVRGTYSPIFSGASAGTVLVQKLPIAGPIWKQKVKNDWVMTCYGCNEAKSSRNDHSWLTKWAWRHRCENRIDSPK